MCLGRPCGCAGGCFVGRFIFGSTGLWTACKNAGISRKQGGRSWQQEELRALAKDKLLAVLPAVSFQALLDYAVPGEMGRELEEYGEVLVAAQAAARVTELLRALGAGADELRKVSSVGDRNAKCQWQNTRSAKCALQVARRLHSISERNASQGRFGWGGAGHDCVCGCARG